MSQHLLNFLQKDMCMNAVSEDQPVTSFRSFIMLSKFMSSRSCQIRLLSKGGCLQTRSMQNIASHHRIVEAFSESHLKLPDPAIIEPNW